MKFTSLVLGAVLLTATACTKDELADGDRLPEGQYPVEIARITLGVEGGGQRERGRHGQRVGLEWHGNDSCTTGRRDYHLHPKCRQDTKY